MLCTRILLNNLQWFNEISLQLNLKGIMKWQERKPKFFIALHIITESQAYDATEITNIYTACHCEQSIHSKRPNGNNFNDCLLKYILNCSMTLMALNHNI